MANQPGATMDERALAIFKHLHNLREEGYSGSAELRYLASELIAIEHEAAQKCAEAVNAERVEETGQESDKAYNMALSHGVKAIGAIYQLKAF